MLAWFREGPLWRFALISGAFYGLAAFGARCVVYRGEPLVDRLVLSAVAAATWAVMAAVLGLVLRRRARQRPPGIRRR